VRTRVAVLVLAVLLAGCLGSADPAGDRTYTLRTPDVSTPEPTDDTLEVHFIDVGHADSTLLIGPAGNTLLIDAGRDPNATAVRRYLDRQGIEEIDILFSTHSHRTSIGGQAAVIRALETDGQGINAIAQSGLTAQSPAYDRYLRAVIDANLQFDFYESRAGAGFPFGDINETVLGPPTPYLADGDPDENSLVMRFEYGNTSILLPGDIGPVAQRRLVDNHSASVNATALKVSRRGAANGSGPAFIDAVSPEVAVVSAANTTARRPDSATFRRLAAAGARTYWTATHGTVVLESDGEEISVRTEHTATTQADRYAEATNRSLPQAGA
jgi:competence protein ComEC